MYSNLVLTSVVYYVATHPEVDEKLQDEFKVILSDKNVDVTNIDKLVYVLQIHCIITDKCGSREGGRGFRPP